MENYADLSENESKEIHDLLLRDPDENFVLLSKKVLGTGSNSSLPMALELLLVDKSSEQLVQEILEYYCSTSVVQFKAFKNENSKGRKSEEASRKNEEKKK